MAKCLQTIALLCSLGFVVMLLGCSEAPDPPTPGVEEDTHAHDHATEGPHGGHLIELGNGECLAELLHDESTHTVTVYLLDAAQKQPVTIEDSELLLQVFEDGQFVDYRLTAVDQKGRDMGSDASKFRIVDADLCHTLLGEVRARLKVVVDGQQHTGVIEHHAHGLEGHRHEDHADAQHGEHEHSAEDHGHEAHDSHEHDGHQH